MAGPAASRFVVFGIDPHKATHTVVAVDELGRQVAQRTVAARTPQHRELLGWAGAVADDRDRLWAVEDCRHVSRRLERDLLAAGERIVRVPPKLMAATRTSIRSAGKSDPIDALAVARAALREPDLPTARLDEPTRELKLLLDHREDLVAERTRVQNRLRWHVHELDPELQVPAGAMDQTVWLNQIGLQLHQHLGQQPRAVSAVLVAIVAELVDHVRALTTRVNQLTRQITTRVQRHAPQLLTLSGCGPLCAAKLLVETADVRRFKSEAAFAMHAGVAPIPASSGRVQRHRLNRGGNRQLNAALHRIAITQLRVCPQTQAFRQRRLTAGSTRAEALRALKRQLARRVFRLLHDAQQAHQHHQHAAA
jgi:transposase